MTLFLGAASPGPSLAVVIRNSVRGGRGSGLMCAIGHGAGFGIYAAAALTGLVTLMVRAPQLFAGLQWVGVLLLLWLALKSLLAEGSPLTDARTAAGGFIEGFLIALLNPKIALFFLAVFSAVIQPNMAPITQYLIVAIGWAIDTAWFALVAIALSTAAAVRWFERHGRWVDRMMALVLATLAVVTSTRLLS